MSETNGASGIGSLSNADALVVIGQLIDRAADTAEMILVDQSLSLADELEARGLQPSEMALLDYFRANAWACRYQQRLGDRAAVWDFEQPEVRQQVFLLRRAANSPGFMSMDPMRRCQIFTNLGNLLDTLGRFVEARASWNAALAIDPKFWMARANRGRALMGYAMALYDPGHQEVFAFLAHRDLVESVALISKHPELGDPHLADFYSRAAEQITHHFDVKATGALYQADGWKLGAGATERSYRHWCVSNVLFLNPMNDVETASISAHDVLVLPDFITLLKEPPVVVGMFNELKQGYVSARWMLWEGMASNKPHFSDREVRLYNTLDYAVYGLTVEKIKMAFRMAYSILDKIAYFLNHYFSLGVPEKRVSFRTIWREKDNGPVRDRFAKSENLPLRGLFWLSKDLFEKDMVESTEPSARALADLRHHLEHKYVKVHEMLLSASSDYDLFHDTLAHSIRRSELEQRTLRLMQLVRSALIYLVLGMHREEKERAKNQKGMVATMSLYHLSDKWKH